MIFCYEKQKFCLIQILTVMGQPCVIPVMVIFFVDLIKPLPVKPEGTVIFHCHCLFVCPTWFSTLHKLT